MHSLDSVRRALTEKEYKLLRSLSSPEKIQQFLDMLPYNFELAGDSCMSVRETLHAKHAHCIEAALVAAAALWVNGGKPLLLDLSASREDDDHVIALFRRGKYWGAISKSNHAVLGYRDPVYATVRELAQSYMHEYFNKKGAKTLRTYSRPYSLSPLKLDSWLMGGDAWAVAEALCDIPHFPLLPKGVHLRPIDQYTKETLFPPRFKK